jgi:protein-disulfide isomerase
MSQLKYSLTSLIIGLVLVGFGFFIGTIWTENKMLKTGSTKTTPTVAREGTQPQPPQQKKGVASIDDDPVLGDKDAPVTIIEFSDYECPFCKRHFENTFPQLIENYVDTGKVKLVFRDLPLSFHDPLATKEAVAANCAREQGGDESYFKYHDEIFTRTASNGNGLVDSDLTTIATDLGLNLSSFGSCLDDPAQAEEVKKDVADAGAAGASGTPTFVIGKSSDDGKIDGDLLVGAQPFTAFQAVIDPLLE